MIKKKNVMDSLWGIDKKTSEYKLANIAVDAIVAELQKEKDQ